LLQLHGIATLILFILAAEGTKGTTVDTDVGVIDMTVNIEVDLVTIELMICQSCQLTNSKQIIAGIKCQSLVIRDSGPGFNFCTYVLYQVNHSQLSIAKDTR
jgi:hypothetical protein